MSNFPTQLVTLPQPQHPDFHALCDYIRAELPEILVYFPWLTAEMLNTFGPEDCFSVLRRFAGKRVNLDALCDQFPPNLRFKRVVGQNASDHNAIELQSDSGVFECLRRYHIQKLLQQNTPVNEIAATCGASIRTVQRQRKQLAS